MPPGGVPPDAHVQLPRPEDAYMGTFQMPRGDRLSIQFNQKETLAPPEVGEKVASTINLARNQGYCLTHMQIDPAANLLGKWSLVNGIY